MDKFRHKGMTLVELVAVIAIIAVLVGLAVPSMSVYFEKARLRGAADDIVALLAEARQSAVKQNKQVHVRVDYNGTNWCVGANPAADPLAPGDRILDAQPCDCALPAACGLRSLSAASYSGVKRPLGGTLNLRFDPKLGTLSNLGATAIVLESQSSNFRLVVNVNPIGQARVCRPVAKGIITGYPDC